MRLRHEVNWTTRAFAEHSGLTAMTLYEIEHAKYKTISVDTLERLARAFGVHWAVLLGATDAPRDPPQDSIRAVVASGLVRHRTAHGLTQDGLSHAAGVNRSLIANVETRARNVSLEVLQRLATALGVTLTDLIR
jgi:transcriptional regulator with XRE-family HTH domain